MTAETPNLRLRLNEAMKDAMRAKDSLRLGVLRMVLAAIKDRDIAARTEASREGVSDADVVQVLQKLVKQRRESAEAFDGGGRPEMAANERAEAAVIESFLPTQMDEAATKAAIQKAISDTGAASIKDMGKVMAALRERHAGVMDMAKASPLVKSILGA